jgi:hypothetical protein
MILAAGKDDLDGQDFGVWTIIANLERHDLYNGSHTLCDALVNPQAANGTETQANCFYLSKGTT